MRPPDPEQRLKVFPQKPESSHRIKTEIGIERLAQREGIATPKSNPAAECWGLPGRLAAVVFRLLRSRRRRRWNGFPKRWLSLRRPAAEQR
jgi:hypothetical protein